MGFGRAYSRIWRILLATAVTGTVVVCAVWDLRTGAGFAAGAAFSALNFRWHQRFTEALGGPGSAGRAHRAVFLGLRYCLFGVAGYVIVKYLEINLLAVLAGFFVAALAQAGEPGARIHAGDAVYVEAYRVPEMSRVYLVGEDGAIRMPYVPPIPVGGMDEATAARTIAQSLTSAEKKTATTTE